MTNYESEVIIKQSGHNAEMKAISADEGTGYWICLECGNACDPKVQENVISGSAWTCTCAKEKCICLQKKQENKEWEERFDKEFPCLADIKDFHYANLIIRRDGKETIKEADSLKLNAVKSFISEEIEKEKKICEEAIRNYCYDHTDCHKAIESERQRIIGIVDFMKQKPNEQDFIEDKIGAADYISYNQALSNLKDKIK